MDMSEDEGNKVEDGSNQNVEEDNNLLGDDAEKRDESDELKCGRCSKVFTEIIGFLEHKSNYLLACSRYQCELCTQKFSRHLTLLQHYKKQHRLRRFYHRVTRKSAKKEETGYGDHTEQQDHDYDSDTAPGTSATDHIGGSTGQVKTEIDVTTKREDASYLADGSTGLENILTTSEDGEGSSKTVHVQIVVQDSCAGSELENTSGEGTQIQDEQDLGQDLGDASDFNFILTYQRLKGYSSKYSKMLLKCLHCQYKTVSKSALVKHFMGNHQEAWEVNQRVDRDILDGTDREKIISLRVFSENYESLSQTRTYKKYRRSIEKQDLPGIFPCDHCEKVFGRLRYLRTHLKTHRTERSYVCDQCGKGFTTLAYLNNHKRVHRERMFRCSQCDFTSKVNAAIHAHRQLHSQGSVLCDICGYAYTDKPTLAKHKRVHDLSRPFACTYPGCTWRFKTDVMCKAHIRAHTSDGKFRCRFCGYVFRHKHHLQRHESRMHGVNHDSQKQQQQQHQRNPPPTPSDIMSVTEVIDPREEVTSSASQPMNLIINTEPDTLPLHTQQFVVATDSQGGPITYVSSDSQGAAISYEAADLYQALLQGASEAQVGEHTKTIFVPSTADSVTRTILLPQSEGNQIVFQQE